MQLSDVLFPGPDGSAASPSSLWDVGVVNGIIESVRPAAGTRAEPDGDTNGVSSRLLLPSLCHPHLHLDKAYLLTSPACCARDAPRASGPEDPDYSDLLPQTGSFAEALRTTAVAKSRFTAADLRRRGLQLLATSCAQGVTSARVFVEVDAQAAGRGTVAVAVASELQALFRGRLALQVCAFAQEALFTGAEGRANRAAMEAVLEANRFGGGTAVSVLGTTPYVEATREQALANIDWAVSTALRYGLHLDFHLDYNLKEYAGGAATTGQDDAAAAAQDAQPLLFALLAALVRHGWPAQAAAAAGPGRKTVVVGHATQLTCLPPAQLEQLAATVREHQLPLYLVGLPTSDLYMMGRPAPPPPPPPPPPAAAPSPRGASLSAPRGTLPVPALVRQYGFRACLGVNNVGNAFTPHGTGDPLQLACWGVGLYHAGTGPDAQLLYGSISWRAREAIGMSSAGGQGDGEVNWDERIDPTTLVGKHVGHVLVVENHRYLPQPLPAAAPLLPPDSVLCRIPARPRLGFRDVVWDPPDVSLRRVV